MKSWQIIVAGVLLSSVGIVGITLNGLREETAHKRQETALKTARSQLERLCFQIEVKAGVVESWQHDPARSAVAVDMRLALDPLVAICHEK